MLDALILHMPDSDSAPIVYLNPLYSSYKNGSTLNDICHSVIAGLKAEAALPQEMIQYLLEPEAARSRIVYRLISRKQNEEFLKTVPWVPFLDLAVIFHIYLGTPGKTLITSVIHKKQASALGLSTKELFSLAKKNTPEFFPVVCDRLDKLIFGWDSGLEDPDECGKILPDIYVLTNRSGINGAACLLYENKIKDLADRLGTDFFILPSSIHEVLLLPDSEHHCDELRDLVRSINRSEVPAEDVLSDEVYHFCRKSEPHFTVLNAGSHTEHTAGTVNP